MSVATTTKPIQAKLKKRKKEWQEKLIMIELKGLSS
jgi:hypothetical protein